VQASAIERIFDQVPTELLTALTVTTLLASALSLVWLRERYKVRAAKRKALIDPLTGIANRFAFEQRLAQEWKRARRYERPLGMLLLDLDGLKAVNDTHGHSAGDEMIRAVATGLAGDIREPDLVARLAGDEFVVLCPETGLPGMRQLAAKLEELLERGGFRASIGCAEAVDDDDRPEAMVVRADESMYRAKQSRRGRRSGAAADPTASLGFASAT
jgi:diguanylate cyclase (GGDEF)-like protein